MPIPISISNLSKSYRPSPLAKPTRAVDNVSLEIAPGELFFLLGPSGCGKTTLLRMIAGFIEPSRSPHPGQIRFANRDVTHTPPNKRNTAMVFQSYALWPHMTVAQNVAFGLTVRKTPTDERDKRVREALDAVQLAGLADRKPNQLSGGQQQRVALARALVIRPDVLLLDEPLSNLDAKLRADLRLQVREICKAAGITSVYVTHDQHEALSMADRIAIMREGKIEQLATPRELYTRPRSAFVATFLGEANILPAQLSSPPPSSEQISSTDVPPDSPANASSPQRSIAPAIHDDQPAQQSIQRPIMLQGGVPNTGDSALAQTALVETAIGRIRAVVPRDATLSSSLTRNLQVMIRPEAITIVPASESDAIPATLRQRQYLGSATSCICSVGDQDLVVAGPPDFEPAGSPIGLRINPQATVLLCDA